MQTNATDNETTIISDTHTLRGEDDSIAGDTTETSCVDSTFWSIAIDPCGGGTMEAALVASATSLAKLSGPIIALASASACIGLPLLTCFGLSTYQACTQDETPLRRPVITNTIASMFGCNPSPETDLSENDQRALLGQSASPYGAIN